MEKCDCRVMSKEQIIANVKAKKGNGCFWSSDFDKEFSSLNSSGGKLPSANKHKHEKEYAYTEIDDINYWDSDCEGELNEYIDRHY